MPESPTQIRITEDDANSDHVESLLRRQMSLRGERGITAVKKRRWWYQNWFILMMCGGVAAFAAWAIIEPYFDDSTYFQGTIASIDRTPHFMNIIDERGKQRSVSAVGTLHIRDESIYVYSHTQTYNQGKKGDLDFDELKPGQEVGLYLSPAVYTDKKVDFAFYVDTAPPSQSASRASKSIQQLEQQKELMSILVFPIVAAMVALSVGAVDGLICRLPRRAILSGLIGLLIGTLGGFISLLPVSLLYSMFTKMAEDRGLGSGGHLPPMAMFIQISGRGLAWMIAGSTMGLGQAIALRSKRLLLYGFLGGVVGGLIGGLLFDPIYFVISGKDNPSAHLARMVGFTVIGLFVGGMIGVVELLARDAWLRMTEGPLTGKEFLLFKDVMRIGSSSRSDLYLFNDPQVAENHAQIRTSGDHSDIQSEANDKLVLVNGRPTRSTRLRHGDQITIGRTSFLFQSRKG